MSLLFYFTWNFRCCNNPLYGIFEQLFILVQWEIHVFCIILRKRKSTPIRTHNLPDIPYIKIRLLHFSTQCHPYYCCYVFVVAGIYSWIQPWNAIHTIFPCKNSLLLCTNLKKKVWSIPLSQIHSTWYHPTC